MICDSGDVVVVPFPFVDLAVQKRRPAAVLSSRAFNEDNGHSILAMITSAARSHWPSDLVLTDRQAAGLPRDCILRWKVFTLPNTTIANRIGALGAADRAALAANAAAALPLVVT